jgi:hypothetical protein
MGEQRYDIIWMIIRLGLFLLFSMALVESMGYVGLLSGQIVAEVLGLIFMMGVIQKICGTNLFSELKRWYGHLLAIVALIVAVWLVSGPLLSEWTERLAILTALAALFAGYMLAVCGVVWIGLRTEERREVLSLIRKKSAGDGRV